MSTTITREAGSLADQIFQLVREDQVELPPLPEVATRIQELMSRDDVGAKELAETVMNEPAVVAALLRVANSSMFGGLHKVSDVQQAIARLGMGQVSSIVTAVAMKGHFTSDDAIKRKYLKALWDHAIATAIAARFLAGTVGVDGEQAFLGGLLHDTGKLFVLKALDVLSSRGGAVASTDALLDELMGRLHTELGEAALLAWELPSHLVKIAKHHEDEVEGASDRLLLCVQVANRVARKLGFHPNPDPDIALLHEPAAEALGLEDLTLATLMVDLEDELAAKHKLFAS